MTDTDVRAQLVELRRTLARLEREAGVGVSPVAAPPSGYTLVAPGEIIAADHMNRATAQGVMRFASAAARDAAIPVGDRVDGMRAWLADSRNMTIWDSAASAWLLQTSKRRIALARRIEDVFIAWHPPPERSLSLLDDQAPVKDYEDCRHSAGDCPH